MNLIDLTTDLKVAWAVVMGTGATAAADLMKMIPDSVAEWASLLACVLTSVLIVTHIMKMIRDNRKHKIDMAIVQLELARLQAIHT